VTYPYGTVIETKGSDTRRLRTLTRRSALRDMAGPASKLSGLSLSGGWTATKELSGTSDTGGSFSHGYQVIHTDGRKAFLKALDYSRALRSLDPPAALQALTSAYIFERNLLQTCKSRRMDRVVQSVESGYVIVDNSQLGRVDYLILEMADCDVRSFLSASAKIDLAWTLRSLHHIATGIHQLHSANIAHQDVKPSNVLVFGESITKIADLGSASQRGTLCPRDDRDFAGDPAYAPPELLYGHMDPEWSNRRLGCDAYFLGSMIVFMFTGLNSTSLLLSNMAADHRPRKWNGTYKEVLPYLKNAFGIALESFAMTIPSEPFRTELKSLVNYLCEPDLLLRGHPHNRVGYAARFSLERFVSKLDLLARRAEYSIR
jgi:serine/threonine protein kinase